MQSRRHSRIEVGIDFCLSLLVNIGTQMLFYGRLATLGRSSAFAAVVYLYPAGNSVAGRVHLLYVSA
jgi:hypothetical protein